MAMATATERTMGWRWAPRLVGLAVLVSAVTAVAAYVPVRALVNGEAVVDRGVVLERRSGMPRYREHLVIEYQRARRQHRVTIPVWADHDSDAQPGREIRILVDPDDPTVVSVDGWLPAYYQWTFATVVGLALYLGLLVARQRAEHPVERQPVPNPVPTPVAAPVPDPRVEDPGRMVTALARHPLLASLPGGVMIGFYGWSVGNLSTVAVAAALVGLQWWVWGPSEVGRRARQAVLERDRRRAELAAGPAVPEAGET